MILDWYPDSNAGEIRPAGEADDRLYDSFRFCSGTTGGSNNWFSIQNRDHFEDSKQVLIDVVGDVRKIRRKVIDIHRILKEEGSHSEVALIVDEITVIYHKNISISSFPDGSEVAVIVQTGRYMDQQEYYTPPLSPGYLRFGLLKSEETFEQWLKEYDRILEGLNYAVGKGEAFISRIDDFDRFYEHEKKHNDLYERKKAFNKTSCFDQERDMLNYSTYTFSTALRIVGRIRELTEHNMEEKGGDSFMVAHQIYELLDELDRIASHAVFNGQNFFTGRYSGKLETFKDGMDLVTGDTIYDIKTKKIISINSTILLPLPVKNFVENGGYWAVNLPEKINDPGFVNTFIKVLDTAELNLLNQLGELSAMQRELPDYNRGKELTARVVRFDLIKVDINQCLSESGLTLEPGKELVDHMVALLSAADSGCSTIIEDLLLLREYALVASNNVYTQSERKQWQKEAEAVLKRIDRVALNTRYNGKPVFKTNSLIEYLQISGVLKTPIKFSFSYPDTIRLDLTSEDGLGSRYDLMASSTANQSIGKIDQALSLMFHYKQILYTALLYANSNYKAESLLDQITEEQARGESGILAAGSVLNYTAHLTELARYYYLIMASSVYSWEKREFERHARMLLYCASDLLNRSSRKLLSTEDAGQAKVLRELGQRIKSFLPAEDEKRDYFSLLTIDTRKGYSELTGLLEDIEQVLKKGYLKKQNEPEKETEEKIETAPQASLLPGTGEIDEKEYYRLTGFKKALELLATNYREINRLEQIEESGTPYVMQHELSLYRSFNKKLINQTCLQGKKILGSSENIPFSFPLGTYILEFPRVTPGTLSETAELADLYCFIYRLQYDFREKGFAGAGIFALKKRLSNYRSLSGLYGKESLYGRCYALLSGAVPDRPV